VKYLPRTITTQMSIVAQRHGYAFLKVYLFKC